MSNTRLNFSEDIINFFESKIQLNDTKMDCNELELNTNDIQNLVLFLKTKPNLLELNLNYNNLCKEGVEPLKEIILQNKLLKKISLLYN